jgi:hypothetical protein
VPAPKSFHKPPIIIYQGVVPPVHVYEESSGGYSPVAQAKSGNVVSLDSKKADTAQDRSDTDIITKDSTTSAVASNKAPVVAQARSAQFEDQSQSAVVGASVSFDEGFEILKKGTVESIDPKAD